jgi:predicted transcriptional regulator
MKNRCSTEIIDTMLCSIRSGAKKTRIMYDARLSYNQLMRYLTLVEDRGLLRYDQESELYLMTQRGVQFMSAYDEIRQLVSGMEVEERVPEEIQMSPLILANKVGIQNY